MEITKSPSSLQQAMWCVFTCRKEEEAGGGGRTKLQKGAVMVMSGNTAVKTFQITEYPRTGYNVAAFPPVFSIYLYEGHQESTSPAT